VEPVACAAGDGVPPLAHLVSTIGKRLREGHGEGLLLGYSMGGRLALHAAFDAAPAALLLIGAAPALDDAFTAATEHRAARAEADAALAARIVSLGTEAFAAEWQQLPIIATQQAAPRWWQARRVARRAPVLAAVWAASLTTYGPATMPSDWSRLASLRCPVCLVVGEHDAKYLAFNRQLVALLPNAELHIVAGAGHAPHLEQPAATAAVLSDFLLRHFPTTHQPSQHA
jgi:2-succinyl-6-hydroxy-2,4-cyclohexadiene-1-carboxylate synthase